MNIEVENKSDNLTELQLVLEDCLSTADELKLSIVAAKISEALDRFQPSESTEC
ncbi:MAG: hypothetical protein ABJO88_04850 [Parasphingorhabdus sp.]